MEITAGRSDSEGQKRLYQIHNKENRNWGAAGHQHGRIYKQNKQFITESTVFSKQFYVYKKETR